MASMGTDDADAEHGVLARLKTAPNRAVGARQTLRALHKGIARLVYVARDADPAITDPIVDLSRHRAVEVVYVESMHALGRACGIEVSASAAAVVAGELPEAKRQRRGGP
ncbi:ribosomal L7Ae/L30e/S12e/Gadd45 family protein [Carboxydochorda subterranea]|uniref:Ribosomal L7Ae/L30e/S12e/Gadd45 family protein n=1 Tax=Carboxydichorda subterranea TaxID=3109565 RepID=A0ABZ1C220_9FIRM|nr:ribosomal L7Ae/L30e/S12e/Gadd45 family protein [Limnochorda sp. L945t]WRP18890.1 ribosomal L7Ae/L30e/S12e/Gadd45 family protein [Limnochorda sp. L945t]